MEMTARIGSLFSGYGGLDLGVQAALGGEIVWHSEIDPNASKILAHHWPNVPNLGDITKIDWADVPPVDILTGGFPCQPVSLAGARKGTKDERWLFDEITTAISHLAPRLCVFENVRGLLTANGGDAMARVVHGLASVGYVGRYGILPASAVGAPHRRERVFIIAHPAGYTAGEGLERGANQRIQRREPCRTNSRTLTLLPTPNTMEHLPVREGEARERQLRRGEGPNASRRTSMGNLREDILTPDFGKFVDAIRVWEQATRPAPPPTELGQSGRPRLSPAFVEWMMGLPAGHVTGTGISRTAQLTALGNGVVPQQAAHAIRLLLERVNQ